MSEKDCIETPQQANRSVEYDWLVGSFDGNGYEMRASHAVATEHSVDTKPEDEINPPLSFESPANAQSRQQAEDGLLGSTSETGSHPSAAASPNTTRPEIEGSQKTAAFPVVLHKLLCNAEKQGYDNIVSWRRDGRSFQIYDKDKFATLVMPNFFRTSTRFASFQRQLSVYGFRFKALDDTKGYRRNGYYEHDVFARHRPDLCQTMRRRAATTSKGRIPKRARSSPPRFDILDQQQRSQSGFESLETLILTSVRPAKHRRDNPTPANGDEIHRAKSDGADQGSVMSHFAPPQSPAVDNAKAIKMSPATINVPRTREAEREMGLIRRTNSQPDFARSVESAARGMIDAQSSLTVGTTAPPFQILLGSPGSVSPTTVGTDELRYSVEETHPYRSQVAGVQSVVQRSPSVNQGRLGAEDDDTWTWPLEGNIEGSFDPLIEFLDIGENSLVNDPNSQFAGQALESRARADTAIPSMKTSGLINDADLTNGSTVSACVARNFQAVSAETCVFPPAARTSSCKQPTSSSSSEDDTEVMARFLTDINLSSSSSDEGGRSDDG